MKLYLDEHIHPLMAAMLRERDIDCRSTQEESHLAATDEEQLSYSTAEHRVLVTFDRRDFVILAQQWASIDRHHAGLILSIQCPIHELLRYLLRCILAINMKTSQIASSGYKTTKSLHSRDLTHSQQPRTSGTRLSPLPTHHSPLPLSWRNFYLWIWVRLAP